MSFINIPNLEASLNFLDITSALGYVPVNVAGDTMLGNLFLNADPTSAMQAATKEYVDSVASGLNAKQACRVASTINIPSLSGLLTIDSITVTSGDRVLVKNQLTASQNGIYIAASGAWVRSTDMNTGTEAISAFTFITSGSTQSSTGWVQITPAPITIGTTSLIFTQFSGPGTYTADGQGIILVGNQFQLQLDGTTLSKSGSGLKVATGGITNNEVNATASIAYSKLSLTNGIVNSDINTSAGIVYSKLNLSNGIVNSDINIAAAIARSKIAAGSANQIVVNDGSGNLSSVAVLPISNGGTGSSTQNFVDLSTAQSVSGDKDFFGNLTFDGNLIINRSLTFTPAIDSTLSGSNANVAFHSQDYIIFTNAGLLSIASIANTVIAAGHRINLVNKTGAAITLINNYGSVPVGSASITTSFGTNLVLPNNGDAQLIYDTTGTPTWNLQNGAFIVQLNNSSMVSGVLPVANGGTGSSSQNYVDLTTAQSIGGNKSFTGITQSTSLEINGTAGAGFLQLDPQSSAPSSPPSQDIRIYTDQSNGITRLRDIDSGGSTFTIHRDSFFIVYNQTGSSISSGKAVYVNGVYTGGSPNVPTIALAQSNLNTTSPAIGLAYDTIPNNSFGRVLTAGILSGFDLSAFTNGQALYLSSSSAGGLTSIEPTAPNISQLIGYVTNAAVSGSIDLSIRSALNTASGTYRSNFQVGPTSGSSNISLAFANANTFTINANPSSSFSWNLPAAQGTAGTVLYNDGSGNLSWVNPASNIDGGSPSSNYTAGQIVQGGTP